MPGAQASLFTLGTACFSKLPTGMLGGENSEAPFLVSYNLLCMKTTVNETRDQAKLLW
jgi:hypothetical protein